MMFPTNAYVDYLKGGILITIIVIVSSLPTFVLAKYNSESEVNSTQVS